MNSADKQAVLHCLKTMIDEEVCEECPLYGTTGTDHCEKDCVRLAINALSGSENPKIGRWKRISRDLYVQHAMAYYECSECGKKMIGTHNYCPNCGANMSEIPTDSEGRE